jgi:hypothetical protein
MATLAIDQYQYLVAAHSTQLWRTNECPAIGDRVTLDLERGHEGLDDVEHVVGRYAFELLPPEDIDRHGRIGGRSALATRANDNYFIERRIDFLLRNRDTRC